MARRRWSKPDPWDNDSVLDALLVARALRHERGGAGAGRMQTSAQLLERLGFDNIDEMEAWAIEVRERGNEQAEELRRRREAGENV